MEWPGDVPEHWETGQLRRRFAVVNGGTRASGNDAYRDGETVWLTPDDLGRNAGSWISDGRRRITEDGVHNSNAQMSPAGSIVLSTRAPIGHIAIVAVPAATNQGCRTLAPDSRKALNNRGAGVPGQRQGAWGCRVDGVSGLGPSLSGGAGRAGAGALCRRGPAARVAVPGIGPFASGTLACRAARPQRPRAGPVDVLHSRGPA